MSDNALFWRDAYKVDDKDIARTRRKGRLYGRGAKRLLDVILVLICSVPVLITVLMLAACVARDGGRPFYQQFRVGRDGRVFRMWKLRTMVLDADTTLEDYLQKTPGARVEWDSAQKLRDDPRVTRCGAWLRRTSLDELPQLWNVLTGEMSLVGPRPMLIEQRALYPGEDYYDLRPGITGLWQVSSRNLSTFAERAEYDSRYAAQLSLGMDIGILARTVAVVFRGTGY